MQSKLPGFIHGPKEIIDIYKTVPEEMIPDDAHMVEFARKVYFSGVTGSMYNKQTFGERTGAEVNEFMGKTSSYY